MTAFSPLSTTVMPAPDNSVLNWFVTNCATLSLVVTVRTGCFSLFSPINAASLRESVMGATFTLALNTSADAAPAEALGCFSGFHTSGMFSSLVGCDAQPTSNASANNKRLFITDLPGLETGPPHAATPRRSARVAIIPASARWRSAFCRRQTTKSRSGAGDHWNGVDTGRQRTRAQPETCDVFIRDAFAFVDSVFSSRAMLGMNSAFLGAQAVDAWLRDPRAAEPLMRRFDREVRHGVGCFSWFIWYKSRRLAPRREAGRAPSERQRPREAK